MILGSFVIAFAAGILSFLSPCIIPMISVYFTMITGMSMDELKQATPSESLRKGIIASTALFIAGFTVVFTLAGGAAGQIGRALPGTLKYLNLIGGVFVIAVGLKMLGVINFKAFDRLTLGHIEADKPRGVPRYLSAFLIGLFFAVACSHCIAPTLYSMLIFAGSTGSPALGMGLMFAFSVGLAIPYFLVGISISRGLNTIRRWAKRRAVISGITGALMIGFGILMVMNKFQLLTQGLSRLLPYRLPLGM